MSGAYNALSMARANLMKGTAAVKGTGLSGTANKKQSQGNSFDQVLNNLTSNRNQTQQTDIKTAGDREIKTEAFESRKQAPYRDTAKPADNTGLQKALDIRQENITQTSEGINEEAAADIREDIGEEIRQDAADIIQEIPAETGEDVNAMTGAVIGTNTDTDTEAAEITVDVNTDVNTDFPVNINTGINTDIRTDFNEAINTDATAETPVTADTAEILQRIQNSVEPEIKTVAAVETDNLMPVPSDGITETDISAGLNEAIERDVKEIVSRMTEDFNISEQDIVNAMQVLGLMAADLLNPTNIQQVVTQALGKEQAIDLITDSDIYTSLQDLMEGAESMKGELMNEFDLSEEGLQAAIENAPESFGKELEAFEKTNPEEAAGPEITEKADRQDLASGKEVRNTRAPQSEAFTEEKSVNPQEEKTVEINIPRSKSQDGRPLLNAGNQAQNLFNQVMNGISEAAQNTAGSENVAYTDRAQMENIVRQITERITITASAEETSMELALHPASLGHVNILLTSGKDGIIAKFTAQNQIVKEAVESQMVQLQQKFEEQGIKVTSVEVTIASHGFEQNLEQGNDRRSDETNGGRKTKPLRRINLSEIDDSINEASSDAEKIAVQMMEMNGNSVDFSA